MAGWTIDSYPLPLDGAAKCAPPFPRDPHYDAKTWETVHGPP
jgi:hypothetical protein